MFWLMIDLLLVLFGYIADMLSARRTPFILSLILSFLSTVALALSTNIWVLLAARLLEGLSTAIVSTFGFALIMDVVGRERLGSALGYTSVANSIGLLIGPVIGGVLYDYCGYFQVYLPALGLLGIEIVLRLLVIEKKKAIGTVPCTSSLAEPAPKAQPIPIEVDDDAPKTTTTTIDSDPLLPSVTGTKPVNAYQVLLRSPQFLVALIALFSINTIACGFDSTLTPYIHDTFNMHATHAAALFLALAVPMLLGPVAGWIADRYGPKLPTAVGLMLASVALALMTLVSEGTPAPFAKLAVLLVIVGFGFALALTPLRVEASLVVDRMEREKPGLFGVNGANGSAFGLMNTMVAAGGLVGPLYAGFVRVVTGWEALSLINGALSLALFMLVILITGGKREEDVPDMAAGITVEEC